MSRTFKHNSRVWRSMVKVSIGLLAGGSLFASCPTRFKDVIVDSATGLILSPNFAIQVASCLDGDATTTSSICPGG